MTTKAKESIQVQRARKKIEQQISKSEKMTSPESLDSMRKMIQRQISRHSKERINLKNRDIVLFDENKHPAKTESKFVHSLLNQLQHPKKSKSPLGGRITSMNEEYDTK